MQYPIITSEELRDTLYINRKPISSICDQKGGGNWLQYGEGKRTSSTNRYGNKEFRRSFGTTMIVSQCNKAKSVRIQHKPKNRIKYIN